MSRENCAEKIAQLIVELEKQVAELRPNASDMDKLQEISWKITALSKELRSTCLALAIYNTQRAPHGSL